MCRSPIRFITGFRCHGWLEKSRVLRPIPPKPPEDVGRLIARNPELLGRMRAMRITEDEAEFLLSECRKDRDRGFASELLSEQEMDARLEAGCWVPLPRVEIMQAPAGGGRATAAQSRAQYHLRLRRDH